MSLQASIPPTVQIRRTSLAGLMASVAAVAAAAAWAGALAFDGGSSSTASSARASSPAPVSSAASAGHGTVSLMSFTPAQLFAGTLGGYALPEPGRPSIESVLSSMSPQTRAYTERVMGLTFEQLAAGAAGQP